MTFMSRVRHAGVRMDCQEDQESGRASSSQEGWKFPSSSLNFLEMINYLPDLAEWRPLWFVRDVYSGK